MTDDAGGTGVTLEIEPYEDSTAIFTFVSTHQAMVAEAVLHEAGVKLEVVPLPRELSAGCGLALRVSLEDLPAAKRALAAGEAAWESVYELGPAQQVTRKLG